MNDCEFQLRISAYHDRELDAEAVAVVERHLKNCTICTMELAAMREFSTRVTTAVGEIDHSERLRLHRAIDIAADSVADEGVESLPMFRTMGLLAALAASVLIVSGVWLIDLKTTTAKPRLPLNENVAMLPDWQRVAVTLHSDPRPGTIEDSLYAPRYAGAVHLMLDGLMLTER